jgi:hypothetical protein
MEDRGNAEKEFRQVFRLQPNYEADKKRSPPAVLEFVEYVRARIRDDALRVEPAQPPEPAVAAPAAPVDAPKFNPLSLIPFGIGQLATGDYTAGTIFISFDVALFAASLSLYLVRQSERAPGDEYLNKPRADAMQIAQNVLSGAFVAVAIIGFVDALVWSPKRVAEKKRIMVVPTVSASAFGTAMGGIAVLGAF